MNKSPVGETPHLRIERSAILASVLYFTWETKVTKLYIMVG